MTKASGGGSGGFVESVEKNGKHERYTYTQPGARNELTRVQYEGNGFRVSFRFGSTSSLYHIAIRKRETLYVIFDGR